jgi:ATP-binding cassette subfamily B protein
VLQEPFFFATTIRENLLYGNQEATEDEMFEAARLANASHFISRLPKGYDTILTERGLNISQGERQLLGITRAILRNPSILILDEATSNIDSLIEAQIQEAVLKLMRGRTCLTIAHRLSTIKNADRIIVIHNHRIIEEGTYSELIAKNGFYARLYSMQKSQVDITEDMFE